MRLLIQLAVLATMLTALYAVSLGTSFVIGVTLSLFNGDVDVVSNAYVFAQYTVIVGLVISAIVLISGRISVETYDGNDL